MSYRIPRAYQWSLDLARHIQFAATYHTEERKRWERRGECYTEALSPGYPCDCAICTGGRLP